MSGREEHHIEKLSVESLSLVDKAGVNRLLISIPEHYPEVYIMDGREIERHDERSPGMLFFNDEGEECGGLVFGGGPENPGAALRFDRHKRDQVIGIDYDETSEGWSTGFYIWDEPTPLIEVVDLVEQWRSIPEGPEKDDLYKQLEAKSGTTRVTVGRSKAGDVGVTLADSKGRERIRMCVDSADIPRLEFLDEDGHVTYSLPPKHEETPSH